MAGKGKKRTIRPEQYKERSYRATVDPVGLVSATVQVKETDLHILASRDVASEARHLVLQYRHQLETYIAARPEFLTSLRPIEEEITAPAIVKSMIEAGRLAGVGPMAAVAGAVAEFVGRDLLRLPDVQEAIVENGGDIYLSRKRSSMVAIFAGASPLSNKVAVLLKAELMPVGVCTSSGTVGHSLSFGKADSVTVIAKSTSLADALATALGNEVKTGADISAIIDKCKTFKEHIVGAVIILGDKLGAWGDIELGGV